MTITAKEKKEADAIVSYAIGEFSNELGSKIMRMTGPKAMEIAKYALKRLKSEVSKTTLSGFND